MEQGRFGPVDEIWALDMVHQGDGAILNKDKLGVQCKSLCCTAVFNVSLEFIFRYMKDDWADSGRDILQFVLNYLPDRSTASDSTPTSTSTRSPASSGSDAASVTKDELRTTAVDAGLRAENESISHWTSASSALDYPQSVQGYMNEVDGMTSISPGTPKPEEKDNSSASRPTAGTFAPPPPATLRPSTSTSTSTSFSFTPTILPGQPLPEDLHDAALLDLSSSSSINNTLRPLRKRRWRHRRIALIGHSVGANGMAYAASVFPHLFESVTLIEPVLYSQWGIRSLQAVELAENALSRKDTWSSREEAQAAFKKVKSFFGRWDADVLQRYVEFGLVERHWLTKEAMAGRPVEGVALKVSKEQEANMFFDVDNAGATRLKYRLSYLPPSLAVHLICGEAGASILSEAAYDHFSTLVPHARQARVEGAAHLVVQEKPRQLALVIGRFLGEIDESAMKARL